MHIQYWGTAAAEGYPAVFCSCPACQRALQLGGKNIRTRASALLNDSVLLDFSPDSNMNRLRYGFDMSKLKALCITHAHIDHLAAAELITHASSPYCAGIGGILPVFCGADGRDRILENAKFDGEDPSLDFTIWKPYHAEQVTDTIRITPLPAQHDPNLECYIFLIEEGNKWFLYGHDTAFPRDEVFEFLKDYRLDGISLDCNSGIKPSGRTHMGLQDVVKFAKRLEEMGTISDRTIRVINHFSHGCGLTHEELESHASPYGFRVSWDGMELDL